MRDRDVELRPRLTIGSETGVVARPEGPGNNALDPTVAVARPSGSLWRLRVNASTLARRCCTLMDPASSEFGLLPWFAEHGARYADLTELPKLAQLEPYGKVLRVAGRSGDLLVLEYGDITVRIHLSGPFSPVPSPKFRRIPHLLNS